MSDWFTLTDGFAYDAAFGPVFGGIFGTLYGSNNDGINDGLCGMFFISLLFSVG